MLKGCLHVPSNAELFFCCCFFGWGKKKKDIKAPTLCSPWRDTCADGATFTQTFSSLRWQQSRGAHRSQILIVRMRRILLKWIGAADLETLQKLDILQRRWRRQSDGQREEQDGGARARELQRGTPGDSVRVAGLTQLMVLQEKHQNISVTLISLFKNESALI